jgi:L-iditol 2-dehydrogenase
VNGGFTSLLVVPARNIHSLPGNVSSRAGALVEPLACVVHALLDGPSIRPHDLAIVAGPGAIGLLALQVLRATGARVIMVGTMSDLHRLEVAKQLGAVGTFVAERDDVRALVGDLTGALGADIVCECSGAGASARDLLSMVRRGGQYVQVGLFGTPISWDLEQVCYKELTVTGSNASVPTAWSRAIELLAREQVLLEPLISGVYPLVLWREAFNAVEARTALKILLTPIDV